MENSNNSIVWLENPKRAGVGLIVTISFLILSFWCFAHVSQGSAIKIFRFAIDISVLSFFLSIKSDMKAKLVMAIIFIMVVM